MIDKLKPCPFCGSEDVKLLEEVEIQGVLACFVNCRSCNACGSMFLTSKKKEAIAAWNRRANNDK